MTSKHPDITPKTPVTLKRREFSPQELAQEFDATWVASVVGMQQPFIGKVLGRNRRKSFDLDDVLTLLDQDAFSETFVPRSRIPDYLLQNTEFVPERDWIPTRDHDFILGDARGHLARIPNNSVQCVVTSTPYWGTRLYDELHDVTWADGEVCQFGHEQTPEGFLRHTTELLYLLRPTLKPTASVWWNLMDTYNTRTQIRSNASETLNAMKGRDGRGWKDYECRRYSAGHSYLKDGEQCLIPAKVAERASRIGYWVKSIITWKKDGGTLPEPVESRVTREVEYIIHLATNRTPYFDKAVFRTLPPNLGGRNSKHESAKISDIWSFPTAHGTDGHGAQFPIALPARCIALSTRENDLVLDPFSGSGTTAIAAEALNRKSLGIDISEKYINIALRRLAERRKSSAANDGEPSSNETSLHVTLAFDFDPVMPAGSA